MKNIYISILFLLLASIGMVAQPNSNFVPKRLDNNVNSNYSEINPVLDPDGVTLYFSRKNHPENTYGKDNSQDIWYSKLQKDGSWTPAKRMPFPFNTGQYNSILSVSDDGKDFLITGWFEGPKVRWYDRGFSIVTKTGDSAYANPKKLNVPGLRAKNRGEVSNAYLSTDEKILVMTFTNQWGKDVLDLYISKKNDKGNWSSPKIIRNISGYGSVEAPFITSDNNYIFFTADRHKEEYDIMRTRKLDESALKWSEPVVLSDTINTIHWQSYYKQNIKGSWAYFCTHGHDSTKSDIYRVKLYEENPWVDLKGLVYNSVKKELLDKKYSFKIYCDDKLVDSAVINQDSSSYKLRLRIGRKYYLNAHVENFTHKTVVLDYSDYREYAEATQDLEVAPLPYVLVRGKIMNDKTKRPLPSNIIPKIAVNGVLIDSVEINLNTGEYTMRLPHGKSYSMQVMADKYNPIVSNLELFNVDEYKEIDKDLFVEEINFMATVSGRVLSKKTGKPLPKTVTPIVKANDLDMKATIDPATGAYTIKIPVGTKYTLNAAADKYFPIYEMVDLSANATAVTVTGKDLFLVPLEVGSAVKLNNVFFETGKANLKPESYPELDKVVMFLTDFPEVKIEIGGHTDNVGKADKNLKLSNDRAAAVADYIKSKGIGDDRISSKGYGMTKPVVPNTTPANKAKNRRVEFTILDI